MVPLTPASDDSNRPQELKRRRKHPETFGAQLGTPAHTAIKEDKSSIKDPEQPQPKGTGDDGTGSAKTGPDAKSVKA